MDCNPPGSSVNGILQARIIEWVVISFSICILHKQSQSIAWVLDLLSQHRKSSSNFFFRTGYMTLPESFLGPRPSFLRDTPVRVYKGLIEYSLKMAHCGNMTNKG